MRTQNNRANYYLFDAFEPGEYADKRSYNAAVYQRYLAWQHKYLE